MPIANPPAPAKSSTLRIEKPPYRGAKPLRVVKLALPNREYLPASLDERAPVSLVTLPVSLKLGQPEFQPRFRQARERATRRRMPVPETAVNENDFPPLPEHEVRPTGQVSRVK